VNQPHRPAIFVGSSVEGLDVAYAVQSELDQVADVTVWPQGVFELNDITIHRLHKIAESSELAVFVFAPDDEITLRDEATSTVRDNVLFEFGLFSGINGFDRTFFLIPRNVDLHIPTDLLGVTPGTYVPDRKDGNLRAAVGPFCNELKNKFPKPLPFVYSEDTIKKWDQLYEEITEAYRQAITASKTLPYKISADELNELSIFDLLHLYKKTEFFDSTSLTYPSVEFAISRKIWLERGIAAKPWDIEQLDADEKNIRDRLNKIRESISGKA
jgi:hypothetical protein